MDKQPSITVETTINAPIEKVWNYWTKPEHIEHWVFASDDWEARNVENDVKVGGKFKNVMAAKGDKESFYSTGTYTEVKQHRVIAYEMDDGRRVRVEFSEVPEGVRVKEMFDPEGENPEAVQRVGWQSILDNFKSYVESGR